MRKLIVLMMTLSGSAWADTYVVQCTAPSGCYCTAANLCQENDGTLQPQGTFLNRIVIEPAAIGVTAFPPSGETFVTDTGQTIY